MRKSIIILVYSISISCVLGEEKVQTGTVDSVAIASELSHKENDVTLGNDVNDTQKNSAVKLSKDAATMKNEPKKHIYITQEQMKGYLIWFSVIFVTILLSITTFLIITLNKLKRQLEVVNSKCDDLQKKHLEQIRATEAIKSEVNSIKKDVSKQAEVVTAINESLQDADKTLADVQKRFDRLTDTAKMEAIANNYLPDSSSVSSAPSVDQSVDQELVKKAEAVVLDNQNICSLFRELLVSLEKTDEDIQQFSELISLHDRNDEQNTKITSIRLNWNSKFDLYLNYCNPANIHAISLLAKIGTLLNFNVISPNPSDSFEPAMHSAHSEEESAVIPKMKVVRAVQLGYADTVQVRQKAKVILSRGNR